MSESVADGGPGPLAGELPGPVTASGATPVLRAPAAGPRPGTAHEAATRAPARFGAVFAVVTAGIAVVNLDMFIVNVALPSIGRSFPRARACPTCPGC